MRRSAWVVAALVALGLWASLVPQVTYPSASSGEPDGAVLIAWPGWSVQQDLGPLRGSVGTFRIWVSTAPSAFRDATVSASLIDASTRQVVRQTVFRVSRGYIPARHTLSFPSYVVPHGQRLMLQLGVDECERCHVIYRLANPGAGRVNVMLNGEPDAGSGPLAFAHIHTGSGFRAGSAGDSNSRVRLALAFVAIALAVLAHPRVAEQLRRIGTVAGHAVREPLAGIRHSVQRSASQSDDDRPSGFARLLAAPWYPWPAAAAPILHFLASNPLHFAANEAVVPLIAAFAVVTCSVGGLRLVLKDWHRSAAVSAVAVAVFFGYGHIERAVDDSVDDRALFGIAVVLVAAAFAVIVHIGAGAAQWTRFLNRMSVVLLVFPAVTLIAAAVTTRTQEPRQVSVALDDVAAHLLPLRFPDESRARPDIYYIILDSYARNDALVELFSFDNTAFLRELESRGFYIASEATSNYTYTIQSTPSILNMQYLNGLGERVPRTHDDLIDIARFHSAAAILKDLGYTYIHLESGVISTEVSPLADQVVSFTPSGTLVRSGEHADSRTDAGESSPFLSTRFIRALAQSTALQPLLGEQFLLGESEPYEWWSPHRALQMFDFLSNPIEAEKPKFVFAHIVKPHDPATFDKEGNYVDDHQGFDDYHDPSVASAYVGQLIYVNKLVLDMVDGILEANSDPPVIVIAGDHGRGISVNHRHSILGAFHLPDGGAERLYPTISSVNHFRYIFDFYFDLDLGLIDDRLFQYASDHYDFRG